MESIYRLVRHQEKMVLAMQLVISIAFLLVGLTIPMNNFFVISLAIFWVAAFASASNDVASDGFYMLALENNNLFPRNTQYLLSPFHAYRKWFDCNNRGYLEQEYGDKQKAWSYTMVIVGLIMAALTIYNYFSTPRTEDAKTKEEKSLEPKVSFGAVFASFFKKNKLGSC
jgi:PAT family beta-lactamase induction signal transducer AmpG